MLDPRLFCLFRRNLDSTHAYFTFTFGQELRLTLTLDGPSTVLPLHISTAHELSLTDTDNGYPKSELADTLIEELKPS